MDDCNKVYYEGFKAGKRGMSAKDNPYLSEPNYLANAWWQGCVDGASTRHDSEENTVQIGLNP